MESQRIAGRYLVLRAVGRGGMGVVWLCRDEVLGREVAVKQIGGLPGEPEVETKRAMREARSAAALNHPNVVSVYDVVDHEGRPFLVMEYVEGQTLGEIVTAEGPQEPHRVADVGAQVAAALAAAHERGIVHRDVKPGNVLVDLTGRPKISDFGIARVAGDEQLTRSGVVPGTPGYLSPELARGGDPDPASDVWALGATLYLAAEGQPPYAPRENALALLSDIATRPPRPMERVDGALASVVMSMLDRDAAARPEMATVARRLARIAAAAVPEQGSDPSTTAVVPPVGIPAAPELLDTDPEPDAEPRTATQVMPTDPGPAAGATAAAPAAAAPAAAAPAAAGPAASAPADPTDRGPEAPPGATGGPAPARPDDGRRRRGWLLVPALAVVVLLLALAAYALTRPDGGSEAGRDPGSGASSTTSASTPATTSSSTSASSSATSESSTSTSKTSSSTSRTRSAAPAGDDEALAAMVRSYFRDVTRDRDKTWEQLTAKEQAAAHGRSGYEGFWRTVESVEVRDLDADADAGRVDALLVYTKTDGSTSTERHRLGVVQRGDTFLIDSDEPA